MSSERTPLGWPLKVLCAAALIDWLAACTLIPNYHRPALPVPDTYPSTASVAPATAGAPAGGAQAAAPEAASPEAASPEAAGTEAAADMGWREFFTDDQLRAVIALALDHNRDLRVAVLDIEQSRAQLRLQRAALFPTIEASAGADSVRTPASIAAPGLPAVTRDYSANIGISAYELDLFGRLRSLTAEAQETLLATEEARRNVQISLVAEVATDYLTLASDRRRLALADETLRSQSESLELTRREASIGVASDLSLREAETTVERARVDLARYRGQIAADVDALDLVVGTSVPEALQPVALDDASSALALAGVPPAGLPSDLLERRPDILEAERALRAANANIGAARAAFFPSITLTAAQGTASDALSGLFAAGSSAWTFAPQVTLPILTGGRNLANLKSAQVARDIEAAKYEHAVQSAFREVADALARRASLEQQLTAQQALVAASSDAYRLSDARFRRGVDSYLNALDAQRSLYAAQQDLIGIELSRLSNLVTLYQALGGGWLEHSAAPALAKTAP
jgi:multidrug efflux system outer membrane protein